MLFFFRPWAVINFEPQQLFSLGHGILILLLSYGLEHSPLKKLKDDQESLQNGAREEVDFEAMTKSYVQKIVVQKYIR